MGTGVVLWTLSDPLWSFSGFSGLLWANKLDLLWSDSLVWFSGSSLDGAPFSGVPWAISAAEKTPQRTLKANLDLETYPMQRFFGSENAVDMPPICRHLLLIVLLKTIRALPRYQTITMHLY